MPNPIPSKVTVQLEQGEVKWILALTAPRVAVDPLGKYGDPANGIDAKLRTALDNPREGREELDDLRAVIDRACEAVSKGDSPDSVAAYIWSNVVPHLAALSTKKGETDA